jgi:membrane protein
VDDPSGAATPVPGAGGTSLAEPPIEMKHPFACAWTLLRQTFASWSEDDAPSMGAALAYYSLFSIGPLLVIVIAVMGIVFGEEVARRDVMAQLSDMMGSENARAVQDLLERAGRPGEGELAALVSLGLLLVGATTVFAELQNSLDRIWRAPPPDKSTTSGLWIFLRARLLSFGLILGIGFLLVVSLAVSAALSALGNWWQPLFGAWQVLARALDVALSLAVLTAAFAMIYKFMPSVHIGWRDVWVGAGVTALMFTVGKLAIGAYIGRSEVASQFGAAASLAVLLLWVYYAAQIFLMGAEFTRVYAHLHGTRSGEPLPPPPQDAARQAAGETAARATTGTTLAAASSRAAPSGLGASRGTKGKP